MKLLTQFPPLVNPVFKSLAGQKSPQTHMSTYLLLLSVFRTFSLQPVQKRPRLQQVLGQVQQRQLQTRVRTPSQAMCSTSPSPVPSSSLLPPHLLRPSDLLSLHLHTPNLRHPQHLVRIQAGVTSREQEGGESGTIFSTRLANRVARALHQKESVVPPRVPHNLQLQAGHRERLG